MIISRDCDTLFCVCLLAANCMYAAFGIYTSLISTSRCDAHADIGQQLGWESYQQHLGLVRELGPQNQMSDWLIEAGFTHELTVINE